MWDCCGTSGGMWGIPASPGEVCFPCNPASNHAKDYKLLDVPENTPCFLCGGPWAHHIGKLTGSRKERPRDQQQARRTVQIVLNTHPSNDKLF